MRAIDYTHKHANSQRPFERLVHKLLKVSIEVINFKVNLNTNAPHDFAEVVAKCTDLEYRLATWYSEAMHSDESWRFERIHDPSLSPIEVWRGVYHVYSSFTVPMMWYFYSSIRSMLNFTHDRYLRGLNGGVTLECLRLAKIRCELLDDLCAGVPTRLGVGQEGPVLASG